MQTIPLFPLHAVLFPGTPIHLHIFEERYRQMIRFCLEERRPFGVALIRQGDESGYPLAEPYSVGCTAEIIHSSELPDGRFNLVAMGEERFKVFSISHKHPYLVGEVECLPMDKPQTVEIHRGTQSLKETIRHYLNLLEKISPEPIDLTRVEFPPDPLPLLYLACAILQIPPEEKQPLLAASSAGELFHSLRRLYAREISLLPQFFQIEQARQHTAWLN